MVIKKLNTELKKGNKINFSETTVLQQNALNINFIESKETEKT